MTYPFSDGLGAFLGALHVALLLLGANFAGQIVKLGHDLFLVCLEILPNDQKTKWSVTGLNTGQEAVFDPPSSIAGAEELGIVICRWAAGGGLT